MWIRHIHVLLLFLLPHVYSSPIVFNHESLIATAKKKHMNSTRDNTSTQDSGEMMCASQYRKRSIYSNGDCSSAKPTEPIIEHVCVGRCVRKDSQPIELFTGQHYRCKPDKKVTKTVKLLCSGTSVLKSIKVKVVESCKCVLTKKKNRKHKKGGHRRRKNKTDNKNKKRKGRGKSRGRNRRKQRKNKKSSKLTNNDR